MDANATTHDIETPENDEAFGGRIRTSLAVVQTRISAVEARAKAQWIGIPTQIRRAVDKLVGQAKERLRSTLDLPSKTELAELLERVEALDGKLDTLQQQRESDVAKAKKQAKKQAAARRESGQKSGRANARSGAPSKNRRKETIKDLAKKSTAKRKTR